MVYNKGKGVRECVRKGWICLINFKEILSMPVLDLGLKFEIIFDISSSETGLNWKTQSVGLSKKLLYEMPGINGIFAACCVPIDAN